VLSSVLETYLFISIRLYGMEWLMRPFVLVIAAIIVFSLYQGLRRPRVAAAPRPAGGA
jgi:putative tricarboxylic transport membrane protein